MGLTNVGDDSYGGEDNALKFFHLIRLRDACLKNS